MEYLADHYLLTGGSHTSECMIVKGNCWKICRYFLISFKWDFGLKMIRMQNKY